RSLLSVICAVGTPSATSGVRRSGVSAAHFLFPVPSGRLRRPPASDGRAYQPPTSCSLCRRDAFGDLRRPTVGRISRPLPLDPVPRSDYVVGDVSSAFLPR